MPHLWPTGSSLELPPRLRPGTSPHTLRIPSRDGHPVLRSTSSGGFRSALLVSGFRLRALRDVSIPFLSLRPARSYPRFWIRRSSSERRRDLNPPDLGAAQRTNRPHPPRSQAHRDFTAQRLIRDAFAVRERLGDPRAVPSFRCTFPPGMPPPRTPGSSTSSVPDSDVDIGLRQDLNDSALPKSPQSVSREVSDFEASTVRTFATACQVARPPCTDPTSFPAVGDFYFRASNGSVALPVAGYDYNSDWTPLLVRLSLTGMAASFAAPDPAD